jgi:hypothetical protein
MALIMIIPLAFGVVVARWHWRRTQANCHPQSPDCRDFYRRGYMVEEIAALRSIDNPPTSTL